MKRCLVFLVVGEKYKKLYDRQSQMFENYAKICNAQIKLITVAPDETGKRHLLAQKLLIPQLLKNVDIAAFLDLDIIISPNCPSIFESLPSDKHFGAVLDIRGSDEYKRAWAHLPHGSNETTSDYFEKRNFPPFEGLHGSINGGIFVFRPEKVAKMFRDYYFSDHIQSPLESYEEAPMAYLTQSIKCFQSIDPRFNTQLLYKLKGSDAYRKIYDAEKKIPSFVRKMIYKMKRYSFIPSAKYEEMVIEQMTSAYILHFSGGLPIPKLVSR